MALKKAELLALLREKMSPEERAEFDRANNPVGVRRFQNAKGVVFYRLVQGGEYYAEVKVDHESTRSMEIARGILRELAIALELIPSGEILPMLD